MSRVWMPWLLAGVLISPIASAQTLLNAWDSAQTYDAKYQMALATRDVDSEEQTIGRAALLPQVAASAARGRAKTISTVPTLVGTRQTEEFYTTENWIVQLRQTLFDATDWANFRSSQARKRMADATLAASKQSLGLRLFESAARMAQAQAELQAAEVALVTGKQVRNATAAQWQAGELTRADAKRAQARATQAKRDRDTALANLKEAQALWQSVVGQPVGQITLSTLQAESLVLPGDDTFTLMETAAINNPAMQAARYGAEMVAQQVKAARAGHYPTVDLVASKGFSNSETDNTIGSEYDTSRVQVQVQVPIYSGGATSARVRQALARERLAQAEMKDTYARLNATLAGQVQRFRAQQAGLQAALDAHEAADAQYRQAELGRLAGTATHWA